MKYNGIKCLIIAVLLWGFLMPTFLRSSVASEFSMDKAKRVDMTLKHLAKKKKAGVFLRKITFSQDELNSYLNLIYIKKFTPEVKLINLKLEKNNAIDATMKIKLEGQKYKKVPDFLKDIEVETEGKVECENYRMRILFKELKINGTTFSPELLDEAFGAAQVNFKVKKSMFDWFELMPGIKNVVIDHKKITLFY